MRYLAAPGVQILAVAAERWAWDGTRWYKPGVSFRRLLALIETDCNGVAVVDMMRISGGAEHWRICRGCAADFATDLVQTPRTGTIAGAHIDRGELGDLTHPEYAALAYMDDVATLDARSAWRGSWQLDAGAHLDRMAGASYTTQWLADSLRGQQLATVEGAIAHKTDVPARFFGLRERGRIEEGWHADLVVFDPETVGAGEFVLLSLIHI